MAFSDTFIVTYKEAPGSRNWRGIVIPKTDWDKIAEWAKSEGLGGYVAIPRTAMERIEICVDPKKQNPKADIYRE